MRRSLFLRGFVALVVTSLVPVIGCSSGNGLTLAKVSGKVTYKGQPVQHGLVSFMPDQEKGTIGPPAVGALSPDGSYVLSTETSGDGAIVGSHKVAIVGVETQPVSDDVAPDPTTNSEAYLEAKAKAAAIARASVSAGRKQADLFTDKSGQRFRYVVPKKLSSPGESGIIAKVERGSNKLNIAIDENGNAQINP
jgi:hypothetical protein